MSIEKVNLLNFSYAELKEFFVKQGEKPFRATQLIKWVHQLGVTDFSLMTNFSLKLRTYLEENAELKFPEVVDRQFSVDGTRKWALKLFDDNLIEMVFIPEDDRGTLCVSSQAGCALACVFCATATLGCKRNLEIGEIIGQVWLAISELSDDDFTGEQVITNVVMMGMGEPLLNFANVVAAMDLMLDDNAYGLSKYRVTLSTSGIVPYMRKLKEASPVALAVSLHAPNDELRSQLMPINKKYPLAELIPACEEYFQDEPRRSVTFEYVMLKGVNDSVAHAKELMRLLEDVRCKINLIPFNEFPGCGYECSSLAAIHKFRDVLFKAGFNIITRKTRGNDIKAACGQLAGDNS